MNMVLRILETTPPEKVGFVSYTRAAADEIRNRACAMLKIDPKRARTRLPWFGSIHSLSFRRLGISQNELVTGRKLKEFTDTYQLDPPLDTRDELWLDEAYRFLPDDGNGDMRIIETVVRASSAAAHRQISFHEALSYVPAEQVMEFGTMALEGVYERYCAWKREMHYYDYEDLLLAGREIDLPVTHLIVDEAQDLSPLLWDVVDQWGKTVKLYVCAGDPWQCQPAGTQVLTTAGNVAIEDLDPAVHRLVSYDRSGSYVVGKKEGYPFELQALWYNGPMYKVKAGGRETRCTGNHRWPFRWSDAARDVKTTVVYLQRKGNWWRVGWCQLFNNQGGVHFSLRARLEGADEAWVLKTFDNKADASIYESYVSVKYGVPTIPFREARGAQHYTQEKITQFFSMFSEHDLSARARLCLQAHGRHEYYPFWSKAEPWARLGVRTPGETVAYNLLPGLMCVIAPDSEMRQGKFRPLTSGVDPRFQGTVYSLNVEPYHLYIADGLVTHNSLYQFTGGAPDLFLNHHGQWHSLGKSRRLTYEAATYAKEVLEYAGVAGNTDLERTLLEWEGAQHEGITLQGTTAYLGRTHKIVQMYERELEERGVPYTRRGGFAPMQQKAARAYRTLVRLQQGEMLPAGDCLQLFEWMSAHYKKEAKQRLHSDDVYDLIDIAAIVGPNAPQERTVTFIYDTIPHADYYQQVLFKHGMEAFTNPPKTFVGTIHSVKGQEFDHVVLAEAWGYIPARSIDQSVEGRKSEACCAYVGVSRHKLSLTMDDSVRWGIDYPWP